MATYDYLNKTGLGLVWAKIKALVPTKTSDLTNDSGFQTSSQVSTSINTAIQGLDSSISAETGKAIASVTMTDGKITGSTKVTIPTVPTTVSSFTNDAGYLTLSTLPIYDGTVTTGGGS